MRLNYKELTSVTQSQYRIQLDYSVKILVQDKLAASDQLMHWYLNVNSEKNPLSELDLPRIRTVRNEGEAVVYNSAMVETPGQDLSVVAKIQQQERALLGILCVM